MLPAPRRRPDRILGAERKRKDTLSSSILCSGLYAEELTPSTLQVWENPLAPHQRSRGHCFPSMLCVSHAAGVSGLAGRMGNMSMRCGRVIMAMQRVPGLPLYPEAQCSSPITSLMLHPGASWHTLRSHVDRYSDFRLRINSATAYRVFPRDIGKKRRDSSIRSHHLQSNGHGYLIGTGQGNTRSITQSMCMQCLTLARPLTTPNG